MRQILLAVLLMASAAPLYAQGATVSSPVELARIASQLKPGQWVWAPQVAPEGPVTVYVDLSAQRATVYRNGVRIGVSTVSTGKAGYETPTGVFTILAKFAVHHSNKYNSASMPFTQRLTMDGVALHAGGLPGFPESHGCVHLPLAFASALFGTTTRGGTVIIGGAASEPSMTSPAGVIAPLKAGSPNIGASYWSPQLSPTGPVTIVISRADQAAVVLRNGIEIGRSTVSLPTDLTQPTVLTMTRDADGVDRWFHLGVPGHDDGGEPLDPELKARVKIPDEFYRSVMAVLQPGATVLVTSSPLSTGSTGKPLTVIDGVDPKPVKP